MKYLVKRPHIGDRAYSVGEIREADAQSIAHLVRNGVLVEYIETTEQPKKRGRK